MRRPRPKARPVLDRPRTSSGKDASGPQPGARADIGARSRPRLAAQALPGHVCLGAIAGAFGVRGEVRIKPFTEEPFAIAAYGPVRTEDGRSFALTPRRLLKGDMVSASIEGVMDRDSADGLKGTRIYVARDCLPEPEEDDEFYHADLIGLPVEHADGPDAGIAFGRVRAVVDFGAGDLLDIVLEGSGRSVLVPFTQEAVPVVDVAAGRLAVSPPEGLFDDSPPEEAKDPEAKDAGAEESGAEESGPGNADEKDG